MFERVPKNGKLLRRTLRTDLINCMDQQNESPMETFCLKKIIYNQIKLIFPLGAKVFVFEIKLNLNIKNLNPLNFVQDILFFKCYGSQYSKIENVLVVYTNFVNFTQF